jgi:hypothetical protein
MWDPQRLTTLWAFTACYRDSFTYFTLLTSAGNEEYPGHVSTTWNDEPVAQMRGLIRNDRRLTIREEGFSYGSSQVTLTEGSGITHVSAKSASRLPDTEADTDQNFRQ